MCEISLKQTVRREPVLNYSARNIIIIFLLSAACITAQMDRYKFQRISIQEGLSQSTVNCILQDNFGFLWIGTQDGLNRYDGYSFNVYRHNYLKASSVSDNNIITMYISRRGDFWIGTEAGGLNKFDRNSEEFISYTHQDGKNSISDNYIWAITEDQNGYLWIATREGLNKFDPVKNIFTVFKSDTSDPASLSSNHVFDAVCDKNGYIWVATSQGLNRFDPVKRKFKRYGNTSGSGKTIGDNLIISIYCDNSGTMWFGTYDGKLNRYNYDNDSFITYQLPIPGDLRKNDQSVLDIKSDKKGNIWLGTAACGLFYFNTKDERFTSYTYDHMNPYSLASNEIFSLYVDREGIIWVGTYGAGISKLDIQRQQFPHYKYLTPKLNNNIDNAVFSFCEDSEGFIWVGTSGGLNRFDPNTKEMLPVVYRPDEHASDNNYIHALYADKKNNLWIGPYGKGLDRYNIKTKSFRNYKLDNASIVSIIEDNEGFLWLGDLGSGVIKLDPTTGKSIRFKKSSDNKNGLSNNEIQTMILDSSGTLWIGTAMGLSKLNTKTYQISYYHSIPGNTEGLSHNIVLSICQDPYNPDILWLGTSGGGLNRFSKRSGKCIQYNEEHGLPNNMIYGIQADSKGDLWLSTNFGLSRLNPATMIFRNFDETDGLQSNEFNQYAFYKTRAGNILFGGLDGFNLFSPELIRETKYVSPVVLTSFKLFNKPVKLEDPIYEIKEIKLSHKDFVFSFEFAALSFSSPGKNKYAYMMEGFDSDWIYCGSSRTATYTNLEHGQYTFRVKAANSTGVWNEQGTSIKINIAPPFYGTTIFRISIVVLFIFLAFLIYKKRVQYVERLNKKLEKLIKERTDKLHQEIAHRIKVEASLRENEEKFRALIENANDAVVLITDSGTIKYVSPGYERIYGYSSAEVIGHNISEKIEKHNAERLAEKIFILEKDHSKQEYLVYKDVHKNGYEIILEVVISNELHNPAIEGYVLVIRDITERKRAEEELTESEERYRKLVELSPLAIVVHTGKKLVFVNEAGKRIFHAKQDDNVIGRDILDFVHPDYRDAVMSRIQKMLAEPHAVVPMEQKFITLDGDVIDVEVVAASFNYKKSKSIIVVFQDITERKNTNAALIESESKLRESNKNKDKFFSIIAHDLRSPFSSLLGYSDLLVEGFEDLSEEDLKNSIFILNKSIRKVYNLIENLLQWSRLQTDKIEINAVTVDLWSVSHMATSLLEVNALNKNIAIHNEISKNHFVFADEIMLTSVFQNLISNAIKFTKNGGEVFLKSYDRGNYVEVNVVDSGIGISQDTLDRLFKIEIHQSTLGTNEEKGTGLGLILCKELIEKSGGRIWVNSEENKGSTFTFILPKPD